MNRKKHDPFLIFLIVVTYLCNIFDLWYTLVALDFVPAAQEVNPFVNYLLGEHTLLVVLYKYAYCLLACTCCTGSGTSGLRFWEFTCARCASSVRWYISF